MRYVAFSVFLFLLAFPAGLSFAQDAPQADLSDYDQRLAAAYRHLEIVPMDDMMSDMTIQLSRNPSLGVDRDDFKMLMDGIDIDALEKTSAESMAEHFTLRELEALNAFYSKPEGYSVMKKMPVYMADVMPEIQKQVFVSMQKLQAHKKRVEEEKIRKDADSDTPL